MENNEIILQDAFFSGDFLEADISHSGGMAIAVNEISASATVILTPEDSHKLAAFITEHVKQPKETQIDLLEALVELKDGRKVKVVHDSEEHIIEPYDDLDDIWRNTNFTYLEDLLHSTFYKVAG